MRTFSDFLAVSKRKLSAEQLAAVESDVATVVSAGAGSGKTTVLSCRFLRLIMEEKAKVDEILTLTFTKKAASEMYERIYSLLKSVSEDEGPVKEALASFSSASISTLDSFSNEIARTDTARYGISRDFDILDQDGEERLIKKAVSTLYESEKEVMLPLSRIFNPDSIYSDLFLPVSSNVTILTEFDPETESNIFISFLNRIEKIYVDYAFSVLDEIESYKTSAMEDSIFFKKDGAEAIYRIRDYLASREYEKLPRFNLNQARAKIYSDIKAVINEKWRPLLPLLISIKENLASDQRYMRAFSAFIALLSSEKRRMGVLTFSDVSALALRILSDNSLVRAYYKRKFRYIMIDEFQDNSSAQKDLLYILSEKECVSGTGVPKAEDLDNTKLFFVGDDKQSIYAFRNADVSVFNNLKNEIVSIGGKHLSMRTNYRSEPALIDHFNRVFPHVMRREEISPYERIQEDFFSSSAGRDLSCFEADFDGVLSREPSFGVSASVTYALSEEMVDEIEEGDDSDDELLAEAENEAEYIATLVMEIVQDDAFAIPSDSGKRKASYDDIAILYRTSKSQMPLEKVFRREGIPYTVIQSNSITVEALSADIASFLSLLVFPSDKKSYLAILRSPFIRLGDEAIMSIRDAFSSEELIGEPFSHSSSAFTEAELERMKRLRSFYLSLRANMGRLSAEKIIDRLYYESGYSSYIESKMSLSSYKEHYEYLWEIARRAENIFDFLSYLKAHLDKPDRLDVDLLRIRMGGIKLMNIHKSKGLEFPIVILAGANSKPNGGDYSRLIHSRYPGFLALDQSREKGISKLFYDFERRRLEAEAKRLLYVALTRAESHLVVIASGDKIRKGSLASLYDMPAREDERVNIRTFRRLSESQIDSKWESANTFDAFYTKESVVRGTYKDDKAGVKDLAHDNDENYYDTGNYRKLPDFGNGVDELLAKHSLYSDFGTLLHSALEAHFNKISAPYYENENLGEEGERKINDEARNVLERFLLSDFYKKHVLGNETLSEERFYMPYEGKVAEGSIDLLVLGNDYNLVVDYKSDREMNPDFHKGQISAYIKAAEGMLGKKCYGVLLYLRSMESGPFWDSEGKVIEL